MNNIIQIINQGTGPVLYIGAFSSGSYTIQQISRFFVTI